MPHDPFVPFQKYKGYVSSETFKDVWSGKYKIPESPVVPKECYVVVKPLEQEKSSIKGFVFIEAEDYKKDKEVDGIVLASGPGYRVRNGVYPYHYDGMLVPNELKRGDIVRFLERAGHHFYHEGELYYTVEEHKIYFAIDP